MYSQLIRLDKNVVTSTDMFLGDAATWLASDIRGHWSAKSPSTRGSAPAKVTGNLDSSIFVETQGRAAGGRFGGKDAFYRYIRIDTSRGDDPRGRGGYSQALEDKSYLDRPFVEPAMDRLSSIFPEMAKREIKVKP